MSITRSRSKPGATTWPPTGRRPSQRPVKGRTRVWHLYMAGSRLGFEQDEIELHQVLAVRTTEGRSGMPLRPDW